MESLKFSEYFKENYFPVSVNFMTLRNNGGYNGDKTCVGLHAHDFSEIVLLTRGTLVHHCNHQSEILTPGDFLLIHPGMEHSYSEINAQTRCCNILYNAKIPIPILMLNKSPFLQQLYPGTNPHNNRAGRIAGTLDAAALRETTPLLNLIVREMKGERTPHHTTMLIALFSAIIVQLIRHCREEEPIDEDWTLNKVIVLMKARCHENQLSIKDFAKAAGMSPRTLLRRFRAAFGIGPMQYLQKLRVSNAVALLRNSSLTNKSIAWQCGFYNYSHMWYVFQRQLQCTPSEVRKNPQLSLPD